MKTSKTSRAALADGKPRATRSPERYVLRLFVAGATAKSRQAVLRVRELCATEFKDLCDLEVIDIFQQPHLARVNQIVATPTLLIKSPLPVRRFIGDLLNLTSLFAASNCLGKGESAP